MVVHRCGNRSRCTCLVVKLAVGADSPALVGTVEATAASGATAARSEASRATLASPAVAAGAQAEVEPWGLATPQMAEAEAEVWGLPVTQVAAGAEA